VTHDVLIDTDSGDPIESMRVINQTATARRENRVVRGAPRHPETGRDAGDGEVVDHDPAKRPLQPAREIFALGRAALAVS
jgi:hypothetical protein